MSKTKNHPIMTLQEKNKAIIEQMAFELDQGLEERLTSVDRYFASNCVWHSPASDMSGHEPMKEHYKSMDTVFSNVQHKIIQNFAEKDFVITHYQISLVHSGEFLGIPAAGKELQFPLIEICKFENGKIVECWSDYDSLLTLVLQLGGEIKYKEEVAIHSIKE